MLTRRVRGQERSKSGFAKFSGLLPGLASPPKGVWRKKKLSGDGVFRIGGEGMANAARLKSGCGGPAEGGGYFGGIQIH